MSVTVIDVAKEAGVSRTTVSNVFNNRAKFSDQTRSAVLAAARKLGYKPNLAAQSLITNHSRLIGLILPSYVDTNTLTNTPFYNIIIDSVYSVLRNEAYYDLIIFSVPYKEKLPQVSDWIDSRNVDGILVIGEYNQAFLNDLNSKAIPVVLIDNYSRAAYSNFSYINSDDETGGYLATQKLISGGYKKIGICSASMDSPLMLKRYEGYKRALNEAGYKEYIFNGNGSPFEAGMQLGKILLEQQIDAAFCTEDTLAIGFLCCLLKNDVRVGLDFGLVGFDNINNGRQIHPELTTVDQSIFEKGETATKTLLNIFNKKNSVGSRLVLPVHLITRETAR
jgi:DNA-binding LacI/PurR family transcriptional regulator